MQLAAPHDDPVALLFDHVDVHVGIGLLDRSLQALALHVGLGACAHQIVFLKIFKPVEEVLVIFGAAPVLFVGLKGNCVEGINGVDPHAALDAEAHLAAQGAGQVLLFVQVGGVLVDVAETVDGLARQVRGGGTQVLEGGILGPLEGDAHHIEGPLLGLVVTVDESPIVIEVAPQRPQSFDVLLFCSHRPLLLWLYVFMGILMITRCGAYGHQNPEDRDSPGGPLWKRILFASALMWLLKIRG